MQKRNLLLTLIITLFAISFVSAYPQYYGYGYGSFSLGSLLDALDPSTVSLTVIFIVSFGFIYFALSKWFKGNTGIAGVISFALALGITYGMHVRGFDIEGFFYNIGFSLEAFAPLILFAFIGFVIFAVIKWKENALFSMGAFFILAAIFGLVYETGVLATIGVIMIIIGAVMHEQKKKKKKEG